MGIIQFELDDKKQAEMQDICDSYGIEIEDAISLFIANTIQKNDFPFRLPSEILSRQKPDLSKDIFRSKDGSDTLLKGILAYSAWAEKTGLSEMTLDEINAEIDAAREEMYARETSKETAEKEHLMCYPER